jgi:glycosyltransferase involved in cell wall biosynthesis
MQVAGAEVLVRETIQSLRNAITPTIFCLDSLGMMGEELSLGGIDHVVLNRKPGWDFSASRRIAKAFRARQIDVVHAHQYTPFFYSALAKMQVWPQPKLILTEHGRHYPDLVSSPRRAINRLLLDRAADAVNACCQYSARELSRLDGFRGNRIQVIENGITLSKYGPAEDPQAQKLKLKLDPNKTYISHVARHHPVKDQATLIRGFAGVAADFPFVDLLMVGDGELRQQLEELAQSLGVRDRVVFAGIRKDVHEWLKASEIYAITSVTEAASLTLMEAMATGLPCVVSRVGGNGELIRHEQEGLHFTRGNAAECAAAFRRLLKDPAWARKLGSAALSRARERYRLEGTVSQYYRLYRKLTGL